MFAVQFHGVNADMNQNFNPVVAHKADGMGGREKYRDYSVKRSFNNSLIWLNHCAFPEEGLQRTLRLLLYLTVRSFLALQASTMALDGFAALGAISISFELVLEADVSLRSSFSEEAFAFFFSKRMARIQVRMAEETHAITIAIRMVVKEHHGIVADIQQDGGQTARIRLRSGGYG